MKFLEQLKVDSRRNNTIGKAFVSYRPAVRGMIYYDATNVCQEPKNQITKVNQTVRQSCSNLKEVLYVISFHFDLHR